jgi:predicted amidophosphoribosyltransferase
MAVSCPHCGVEHTAAGRFCDNCGMPVFAEDAGVCPHCGAAHAPEQGRFCDACGMSVQPFARRAAGDEPDTGGQAGGEDRFTVRCRHCGTKGRPPTCPSCGNKMPVPDDWVEE